jgi:hypothetical protein
VGTIPIPGQDGVPAIACGLSSEEAGTQADDGCGWDGTPGSGAPGQQTACVSGSVTSQESRRSYGPWSPWKAGAAHGHAGRFTVLAASWSCR